MGRRCQIIISLFVVKGRAMKLLLLTIACAVAVHAKPYPPNMGIGTPHGGGIGMSMGGGGIPMGGGGHFGGNQYAAGSSGYGNQGSMGGGRQGFQHGGQQSSFQQITSAQQSSGGASGGSSGYGAQHGGGGFNNFQGGSGFGGSGFVRK